MGAVELFRELGKVAGIGGLGLGLFLLVVRAVLAAMPKPKHVPAPLYFKVIDRIILFAFILGLSGVLIYGILEFVKKH